MRFLCLHGAGTSSKIFETQTAALRYELGSDHTYDFVEGVVPHPKAPGIDNFATTENSYFAYYKPDSSDSFRAAIRNLEDYVDTEGPFDGIIAFSQGTSLASAYILEQSRSRRYDLQVEKLPFRCAIFMCGRPPYIDTGIQDPSAADRREAMIDIPTTHIWGSNDPIDSGRASALSTICSPETAYVYVHKGGHEVPRPRDKDALIESTNAIRRMLARL